MAKFKKTLGILLTGMGIGYYANNFLSGPLALINPYVGIVFIVIGVVLYFG